MKSFRKELWFDIPTRREFVNITPQVNECLRDSGIKEGLVLVMGGVKPGQTTDAVAADLAVANGSRLFIEATNVDGVYDYDPRKNPDALRIEHLTFDELIEIVGTEHTPGMNTVIDPKAARIMKEHSLTTYVLDGSDIANMEQAILGEEFEGTTID